MNKRGTASREIIQGIPTCEKMTHHSIIHLFIEFTQMLFNTHYVVSTVLRIRDGAGSKTMSPGGAFLRAGGQTINNLNVRSYGDRAGQGDWLKFGCHRLD